MDNFYKTGMNLHISECSVSQPDGISSENRFLESTSWNQYRVSLSSSAGSQTLPSIESALSTESRKWQQVHYPVKREVESWTNSSQYIVASNSQTLAGFQLAEGNISMGSGEYFWGGREMTQCQPHSLSTSMVADSESSAFFCAGNNPETREGVPCFHELQRVELNKGGAHRVNSLAVHTSMESDLYSVGAHNMGQPLLDRAVMLPVGSIERKGYKNEKVSTNAGVIIKAILSCNGGATLQQIYNYCSTYYKDNFPDNSKQSWENTIRNQLSRKEYFIRRPIHGKAGGMWHFDESKWDPAKHKSGVFRRKTAGSSVKQTFLSSPAGTLTMPDQDQPLLVSSRHGPQAKKNNHQTCQVSGSAGLNDTADLS